MPDETPENPPSIEARAASPSDGIAAKRPAKDARRVAPTKPLPSIPDPPPGMDEQQIAGWIAAHTPFDKTKVIYTNISAGAGPEPVVSAMSSGRGTPTVVANLAGGGRAASGAGRADTRAGTIIVTPWPYVDDATGPARRRFLKALKAILPKPHPRPRVVQEHANAELLTWAEGRGRGITMAEADDYWSSTSKTPLRIRQKKPAYAALPENLKRAGMRGRPKRDSKPPF